MREIGPIVRLQVQRSSLKVGEAPRRRYDPAPLLAVPALRLEPTGAIGLPATDEPVLDVHNSDHPTTRQRQGLNALSVGFTTHYQALRERFGEHLTDGVAGENILVDSDRQWTAAELAPGLVIATASGERVPLARVIVAAPCVEFTRWSLRFPDDARPDRTVTTGLQFLDAGQRGFYAAYDGVPVTLALGDRLLIAD